MFLAGDGVLKNENKKPIQLYFSNAVCIFRIYRYNLRSDGCFWGNQQGEDKPTFMCLYNEPSAGRFQFECIEKLSPFK